MADQPTTPENAGATSIATTPTAADKGTFTQADIDRVIAERLPRAEEAAQKKLLEQLGAKDTDELKQKLDALAKLETERMSEAEKLQKERDAAQAEAQAEKAKAASRMEAANDKLRHAAIRNAASKFTDAEDVWLYVKNNKALADRLKIGDDDTVEGVEDVMKQVEADKKHWLKPAETTPRGTPGNGNRSPALPNVTNDERERFAREIKRW